MTSPATRSIAACTPVSAMNGSRTGWTPNFVEQGQAAVDEVAEVVRELGVEAAEQRLEREVAVEAERHLAQQVVAHGVVAEIAARPAERVGEHDRIDARRGHRLADLLAAARSTSRARRCPSAAAASPPSGTPASTRCGSAGCPCRSSAARAARTARRRGRRSSRPPGTDPRGSSSARPSTRRSRASRRRGRPRGPGCPTQSSSATRTGRAGRP